MKLKALTGQKLANDLAKMMGWKRKLIKVKGKTWEVWDGAPYVLQTCAWHCICDFNQCRTIEDWIFENGIWQEYADCLFRQGNTPFYQSRSNPLQRCQAAWLAWKETRV